MSKPNKDLSADRFDEKFCKIMDIIGDFEGKRLLAEKDELDRNGFTIPESLDKRCLEIIRGEKKKEEEPEKVTKISGKYVLRAVLVAAIIAVLLFMSVCAAFPQMRKYIKGVIFKEKSRYTQISLENDSNQYEYLPKISLNYIPDGFDLISKNELCMLYENNNGDSVYIVCSKMTSQGNHTFDTETVEIEKVTVCGFEGQKLMKYAADLGKNITKIIWVDVDRSKMFSLSVTGVDEKEIIKIVDNIEIKNEGK